MQFTFSPINTADLSTGTFYVHLVNTVPSESSSTVADINISTASNYIPYVLTGLVYNAQKWTFNNFIYPEYNYTTAPIGIVICKQIGSNPTNTDPVLYYGDLINNLLQNIIIPTGKYSITIKFSIYGIVVFNSYYEYTSGEYINTESVPKGIIYMLGSRNNTQTFSTPYINSIKNINPEYSADVFDRAISSIIPNNKLAYDFGSRRIKVGTWAYYHQSTNTAAWTIYGSNTYTSGSLDIASQWTALGSSATSNIGWNFVTCNNNVYWKYLKFIATTNGAIQEMEFYNSYMQSTDQDLMSTVLDSSFAINAVDNSGWGHVWTSVGSNTFINNSLYITGTYTLSSSPVLTLGTRNYKFSIEVQIPTSATVSNIFRANPSSATNNTFALISSTNMSLSIGTGSAQTYNTGSLGIPNETQFDTITQNKVNNNITTNFNSSTFNTINSTFINSTLFVLGAPATQMYVKNLKLVT